MTCSSWTIPPVTWRTSRWTLRRSPTPSNCHAMTDGFFFSSRRRHTRPLRDWSSDVCSSDLEPLYGLTRTIDLRDAGSSIVAFTEWLELGDSERPAADHLVRIEAYNRDDVESNR